jgi:hypothetical protein
MAPEGTDIAIQDIYAALVDNGFRNGMIAADFGPRPGIGPFATLLTGRTEHLKYFAAKCPRGKTRIRPEGRHGQETTS